MKIKIKVMLTFLFQVALLFCHVTSIESLITVTLNILRIVICNGEKNRIYINFPFENKSWLAAV